MNSISFLGPCEQRRFHWLSLFVRSGAGIHRTWRFTSKEYSAQPGSSFKGVAGAGPKTPGPKARSASGPPLRVFA
jgi:hypothetical protein